MAAFCQLEYVRVLGEDKQTEHMNAKKPKLGPDICESLLVGEGGTFSRAPSFLFGCALPWLPMPYVGTCAQVNHRWRRAIAGQRIDCAALVCNNLSVSRAMQNVRADRVESIEVASDWQLLSLMDATGVHSETWPAVRTLRVGCQAGRKTSGRSLPLVEALACKLPKLKTLAVHSFRDEWILTTRHFFRSFGDFDDSVDLKQRLASAPQFAELEVLELTGDMLHLTQGLGVLSARCCPVLKRLMLHLTARTKGQGPDADDWLYFCQHVARAIELHEGLEELVLCGMSPGCLLSAMTMLSQCQRGKVFVRIRRLVIHHVAPFAVCAIDLEQFPALAVLDLGQNGVLQTQHEGWRWVKHLQHIEALSIQCTCPHACYCHHFAMTDVQHVSVGTPVIPTTGSCEQTRLDAIFRGRAKLRELSQLGHPRYFDTYLHKLSASFPLAEVNVRIERWQVEAAQAALASLAPGVALRIHLVCAV